MIWLKCIYWIGIAGCLYSYFVYPVLLIVFLPRGARQPVPCSGESSDSICIIITAYNEESRIREKIENTLRLNDVNRDVEIIVASDGSSDNTHAIVREYAGQGVRLIVSPGRQGKEAAQLAAIEATDCGILIFTDVATVLGENALADIARNFEDPTVGAVSSTDRFVSESNEVVGEGHYVRYEMWLRQLESRANTLVGLSGSFFAARRIVCNEWDIKVPSDFGTAINCARAGLRAVSDPELIGIYPDLKDSRQEHSRKLRTMIRGMTGLKQKPEVLNPFRYGFFAFQVWSHKVMRWAVPWFMLLTFFCNLWLLGEGSLYVLLMLGQIVFYAIAALPRLWESAANVAVVRLINFFVEANWAAARAAIMVLRGQTIVAWQPSRR